MARVKSAALMTKPGAPAAYVLLPKLIEFFAHHGVQVRYDDQTAQYLRSTLGEPREQIVEGADLVVVLGGDGTLLSAARAVGGRETPIFAVNLGGLGFLTTIPVEDLYPELERAINNEQRTAAHRMLTCQVLRGGHLLASYEALNDIVITKASIARMIDVETHVDSHYVCTYKADGLIVSTPTGSTAYSLSAGGPIIYPSVASLGITPICPHTLTNRPVIVPDTSVIQMRNLAEDESAFLTIDGQIGGPLKRDDLVLCRRSEHSVHLVRPPRQLFFDVLRQKLKWGER